jgi:hypothetical protein
MFFLPPFFIWSRKKGKKWKAFFYFISRVLHTLLKKKYKDQNARGGIDRPGPCVSKGMFRDGQRGIETYVLAWPWINQLHLFKA